MIPTSYYLSLKSKVFFNLTWSWITIVEFTILIERLIEKRRLIERFNDIFLRDLIQTIKTIVEFTILWKTIWKMGRSQVV